MEQPPAPAGGGTRRIQFRTADTIDGDDGGGAGAARHPPPNTLMRRTMWAGAYDPCPYPPDFDWDGLKGDWKERKEELGVEGDRVFVNPPFGRRHLGRWVAKAVE
eukprot:gene21630-6108_t